MDTTRSYLVRVRAYCGPVYVATVPGSRPIRTAQSEASFEAGVEALAFRIDRRARSQVRPASVEEIDAGLRSVDAPTPRTQQLETRWFVLTLFPN